MVNEQLLNIKNTFCIRLVNKLIDNFMFYIALLVNELELMSFNKFFIWKSANFADSYWFLYNDKVSLHENIIIK